MEMFSKAPLRTASCTAKASLCGHVALSTKAPSSVMPSPVMASTSGLMAAGTKASYLMVSDTTKASTTATKTSPNTTVSGNTESDMDMDCFSSVNNAHTKGISTKAFATAKAK